VSAPPPGRLAEIKAAIAVECCVRAGGTLLFIDTDGILKVLDERHISPRLRQLSEKYYNALCWLIHARAR
jgi:hypothetical protein